MTKKVEKETRREGLAVEAIHPETGKKFTIYTAHSRLQWFTDMKTRVPIYWAAYLVPKISIKPNCLYEGLLNEKDESQVGLTKNERGLGWICYGGFPDIDYNDIGQEINPPPGKIFLVFVNDKRIIYNWRWESEDPKNPGHPHEIIDDGPRFKESKF